ncbi:hypothetical protein R50073_19270 [Maricurvus nonylphenolicus]|uniref:4Fe-4S binding protein n=1 Tax=Maricurvus nonylphenolicus TaxID=1008307 RepID=UPI0036F28654
MLRVEQVVEVIADKCIGCKACDRVCPTEAIITTDRLAKVYEDKCTGCNKCLEACMDHGAIKRKFLGEDAVDLAVDVAQFDAAEIDKICAEAHLFPDDGICPCTGTTAKEVAAAILNGATTMTDISLQTGVRGVCSMWCTTPVARLMQAAGLELPENNPKDWRLYTEGGGDDMALWKVDDSVVKQYPEYRLEQAKQHMESGSHDLVGFPRIRGGVK